ncbi:MAG: carboxy terminal-processing peptidase [Thermodesulfobacteriota bacterium]
MITTPFRKKNLRILLFLVVVLFAAAGSRAGVDTGDAGRNHEAWRAKLISSLIRRQFINHHYNHTRIDDELSRKAFKLYLTQLDPSKRFLLAEDVAKLESFRESIDDELNSGNIRLPVVAAALMRARVPEVKKMIDELLNGPLFDFNEEESLETDPEKRRFCADAAELRDRWRKMLKYDIASRYLTLVETGSEEGKGPGKPEELLAEAREKLKASYETVFGRLSDIKEKEQFDQYFDSISRAFDPHSNYMPPTEKEDFDIHMKGSLEGIGARLQETDGMIKVVSIIPGGAAARQGELEPDDIILKVGQADDEPVDIVGMRIREAVALIRGKKGSRVVLTVKKTDGRTLDISMVRDVVQIEETFAKHFVIGAGEEGGGATGYVYIPSFYRDFDGPHLGESGRNVTDDVRAALDDFQRQNIDRLIIDLRNNGGGALIDAVAIAGLFIDQGPVVQIKEDDGSIRVHRDDEPGIAFAGDVVIMVNELSASASEILAAALQDYRRAVIVGSEQTHGKGTVQTMMDLDRTMLWPNMQKYKPLGALKVTIQKFYRISGQSTQAKGVASDIPLPDRLRYLEYGEQYTDNAMPWDTIPACEFKPVDKVSPAILARAKEASLARVGANEAFKEIEQSSRLMKQSRDNTLLSLRLDDMRQKRAELKKEGARFTSHGGMDEMDDRETAKLDAKQKLDRWMQRVKEDPYVQESIRVLADLRS